METPILSGSWYSLHRCSCTPFLQNEIDGIGQPVPGADLCRLFAYMGAYCIAHINRSNLSHPYVRCFCLCRTVWPRPGLLSCSRLCRQQAHGPALRCWFAMCTTPHCSVLHIYEQPLSNITADRPDRTAVDKVRQR